MNTITSSEIIKIRDKMPLNELRQINEKTLNRCGYISYHEIFTTMGYIRASKNNYYKPSTHISQ